MCRPRDESPCAQGHCDVVTTSAKALCALTTGCPDNHAHIAHHDGTLHLLRALAVMSQPPVEPRPITAQRQLDATYVALGELLCALSRCGRSVTLLSCLTSWPCHLACMHVEA